MGRLRLLAALGAVIALGLASRSYSVGWHVYDKSLGDVMYAAAAYLVLAVAFPHRAPLIIAAGSLSFCLAVELFKLTGIPAAHDRLLLVRWLLGSVFSWHNLICYAVGVAASAALDVRCLQSKPGARRSAQAAVR
jgi:hypothetical protein